MYEIYVNNELRVAVYNKEDIRRWVDYFSNTLTFVNIEVKRYGKIVYEY